MGDGKASRVEPNAGSSSETRSIEPSVGVGRGGKPSTRGGGELHGIQPGVGVGRGGKPSARSSGIEIRSVDTPSVDTPSVETPSLETRSLETRSGTPSIRGGGGIRGLEPDAAGGVEGYRD
ncbi:hypothetical protein ACFL5O_02010 [Myxococcota bacterium]